MTDTPRAASSATEPGDWLVTVCDHCRCASCWQGEFYCDSYKSAGTVDVTVSLLRKEKRENSHYWRKSWRKS